MESEQAKDLIDRFDRSPLVLTGSSHSFRPSWGPIAWQTFLARLAGGTVVHVELYAKKHVAGDVVHYGAAQLPDGTVRAVVIKRTPDWQTWQTFGHDGSRVTAREFLTKHGVPCLRIAGKPRK